MTFKQFKPQNKKKNTAIVTKISVCRWL